MREHRRHFVVVLFLFAWLYAIPSEAARCLFVSSYHPGYPWSDGIEKGLRKTLRGHCEIHQFNMNTKRQKDEKITQATALKIKKFIDHWQPDIIIAADDAASKYLIVPHLQNSSIPVIFCGINWSSREYDYPKNNITGMIEVAPTTEIFHKIREIIPSARSGFYLAANTLTEHKIHPQFSLIAQQNNLQLTVRLTNNMAQWQSYYQQAQHADFIILSTESGINDWDEQKALQTVMQHGNKFSIAVYDCMINLASMSMHKLPEEQGEWAARCTIAILNDVPPQDIPVIPNQDWDIINHSLPSQLVITIPEYIIIQEKAFYAK
ncbi:MAG: ABC transporter substrate-binding protein [Gammaproteobacteria bacterium]|nr:ABC transporter substrate-binding protein [Gammaproteobacteria bacterium]